MTKPSPTGAERALNALTWAIALIALVLSGNLLYAKYAKPVPTAANVLGARTTTNIKNWQAYATRAPASGPESAVVTIVEFADFECPFCAILADSLRVVLAEEKDAVRFVFRHYPIRGHRFAIPAARAFECAVRQRKAMAMYDALYKGQDSLGLAPWVWFAKTAGVSDIAAFDRCQREGAPLTAVRDDTVAARQLGISSTPTLLINSTMIRGTMSTSDLRTQIAAARSK